MTRRRLFQMLAAVPVVGRIPAVKRRVAAQNGLYRIPLETYPHQFWGEAIKKAQEKMIRKGRA